MIATKDDITKHADMLTRWKKTLKFLATTTVLLVYVTVGLFNHPTIEGGGEGEPPPADNPLRAMRTLVGYSEELRIRRELEGRIECGGKGGMRGEWGMEGRVDERLGIRAFSAFHDGRQEPHRYVRVVALLRGNSSLYCQLCYDTNQTVSCVTRKAFAHRIWSPTWGPKLTNTCNDHHPAIITCLAPPHLGTPAPSRLSFLDASCEGGAISLNITRPTAPPKRTNFVVCVKPLDLTHIRPATLLEWVDINLRLGANKIVVYGPKWREGGAVLGGRAGRGALEWRELSPQRGDDGCSPGTLEESIWHKRKMEIIAYNDCFYSNLYYTKFVIPLDVDEIIVPKSGNNWLEAFRSHLGGLSGGGTEWPPGADNYASFSVRNAYFFAEYPKDAILMLPKGKLVRAPRPPAEGVFGRTLRSYRLSPSTDSVKSFVHVGNTVSVFNHYAFHVLGEGTRRQLIFPETVFQLNHYRNSCDPVLIEGCGEFLSKVVYDDSLEKFRKKGRTPKG